MLSEIVYTGITNLYIIMKNQQNIKQYIIYVIGVLRRRGKGALPPPPKFD